MSRNGAWRNRAVAVLGAAAVLLASVAASVAAGHAFGGPMGRYIVTLDESVAHPGEVGRAQLERYGGRLGFVYRYGPIGYSASLPDDAVSALRRDPRVSSVDVDRHNADALGAQAPSTGIKRIFAFGNKKLEIDEKNNRWINADIAVLDGGFAEEEDLNIVKQVYCNGTEMSATCKEGEGKDESDGHGTRVASVAAAIDNTEGVVGVAPGARLWSIKVFDPNVYESEIVAGINYVTEHAEDIEVLNMSLYCSALPCKREAAKKAITKAVEKGVVVVVIAGNNGKDAGGSDYVSHPDVIAVSGIADYDGKPEAEATSAWWPSCNATKQPGDTGKFGEDDDLFTESSFGTVVDMAAPAVCIKTMMPGGSVVYSKGTSFAGPEVAGTAAILAEQSNPNSKEDVEAIRSTIENAGNFNWSDTSGDGVEEPLLDLSNEEVFK